MLSIVIPTYNESENLAKLLASIYQGLTGLEFEILIVDDNSPDDTETILAALGQDYPNRCLVRRDGPRDLSLSVLAGIEAAKFDSILVMDADLSHPVSAIKPMLEKLDASPKAMVIGSRYIDDGSFDRQWSLWRFVNSHIATLLAKPLTSAKDPMSGFFLFNRQQIQTSELRPIGYKIGLELVVRGRFSEIIESPIQFLDREKGESKMNLSQQFKYLRHLRRLYIVKFGNLAEFVNFGLVGASGFVIDLMFFYLFQGLGLSHQTARAMSFWPAVSWNWALNRLTTFSERDKRDKRRQWLEFVASSLLGFSINYGVYLFLTTRFSYFVEYNLPAFVLGILSASLFNFAASTLFVYSNKRKN